MQPPAPFPVPGPSGAGRNEAARTADELTRQLARYGITRVYTTASEQYAVLSVTSELTVWTNGQLVWCTMQGQRFSWAAGDIETAAARLADLARSGGGFLT
jgi:hypothetical protein